MTTMLDQNTAQNVLKDLKKLAVLGTRQPAISKFNLFRAQWLHELIRQNKLIGSDANQYFEKEYKNMPQALIDKVQSARVLQK
jgi:hypothetical protein